MSSKSISRIKIRSVQPNGVSTAKINLEKDPETAHKGMKREAGVSLPVAMETYLLLSKASSVNSDRSLSTVEGTGQ